MPTDGTTILDQRERRQNLSTIERICRTHSGPFTHEVFDAQRKLYRVSDGTHWFTVHLEGDPAWLLALVTLANAAHPLTKLVRATDRRVASLKAEVSDLEAVVQRLHSRARKGLLP